jgi:hypothetical protein
VWFEQLLARELPTKIEMYRDLRFLQAAGLLPWARNFYLIGALSAAKRAAESIRVGQSPPAPIGGLALSIIREVAPCLRSLINFR